jgi:HlyD family secretion protein
MSANVAAVTGTPAATPPVERKADPGLQLVPATRPAPVHATRPWRWLFAALVVVAAAAGGFELWRASTTAQPVRYVTTAVTRGSVARTVTASGSVNPVITVQVGTYVSGAIQQLFCDYNTRVRKGQLCAKIDPRPYQSAVDQDRANLETAKAQLAKDQSNLAYLKLTFDRNSDLLKRDLVTQDALDSAKSAYDQATAQIEFDTATIDQRQAALGASETNLAYTNIVSPVDGTVVSRNVTMGQTVAASFQTPTLFLIATDLTKMQVDANVSESDIGGIRNGNSATFTVDAYPNHVFEGTVTQIRQAPQSVQNVVTYDVVISVPNPQLLLMPGMTATVRVVIDHRDNVVRVSDQALRYIPGGLAGAAAGPASHGKTGPATQVWVLRNGQAVAVPVAIGLDDDTYAEVVRGELTVGDELITSEQQGGSGSTTTHLTFPRL